MQFIVCDSYEEMSRTGASIIADVMAAKPACLLGLATGSTPVGMYPDNGKSPIELEFFKSCKGVADLIYNPSKTKFILEAEALGVKILCNSFIKEININRYTISETNDKSTNQYNKFLLPVLNSTIQ